MFAVAGPGRRRAPSIRNLARLLEVDPGSLHQAPTDTRPQTHLAIDAALAGFQLEHVEGQLDAVRHLARRLAASNPWPWAPPPRT